MNYFEKKNKIKIDIIADNSLNIPEYIIDLKNKSKKTIELIENFEKLKNLKTINNLVNSDQGVKKKKKFVKKKTFKKKFFKKN